MKMNEQLSTWEERIAATSKALQSITPADLEAKLAEMGLRDEATRLQMLDDDDVFKFGDFREVFKHEGIAVLRLAFRCLKGGKKAEDRQTQQADPRTQQLRDLGFKVKPEDAPTGQLLTFYDPTRLHDPITNALMARFKGKAVIAYNDDGSVALNETLDYVSGLEQGFPECDVIAVNGKLTVLWPIGVKPNVMVDEDPLFPGQPLRNGISMVNLRNWSEIKTKCRQLCRIIVERGEIDPNNREAVLRLMERASGTALSEAYPEADLELRQREIKGEEPKLKMPLGASVKTQNPFGVRRSY